MRITTDTHLNYPELSLYGMLEKAALASPGAAALDFMGRRISFRDFLQDIEKAAAALLAHGITAEDTVTICMPNMPQALVLFYAASRIGATANMLHPQSAQKEISFSLELTGSKLILTLDMFYDTVLAAVSELGSGVQLVVTHTEDELPLAAAAAYALTSGRKYAGIPREGEGISWKEFLKSGRREAVPVPAKVGRDHTGVILYSGGTSGTPKAICLSDYSFNACAIQARTAIDNDFEAGLSMLSCMPCFHGFGLGMNLHAALIYGLTCILMPSFNIRDYVKNLTQKKPNYIAGVPTIFEALLHLPGMEGVKLDFLKGMFCGGDTLPVALKRDVDAFLAAHGAAIQIREGYGLTESVTASCLTPRDEYREGSIGLPFPDTAYAIVKPGTGEFLPAGEIGEIVMTGPTLMLKYLGNEAETADCLKQLSDGRTWLYTGDLGMIDDEGFVFFKGRIKRMIITNGYNVYPAALEEVLARCPEVRESCVIGVPDPRRMQKVKAFVVLQEGIEASAEVKEKIQAVMKLYVAHYALPREYVFTDSLPHTEVGKIDYRKLEEM